VRPRFLQEPVPVQGALARAVFRSLPERFIEEFPLPGGFAGLNSTGDSPGAAAVAPVRVTLLHGTHGRLMVLERLLTRPVAGSKATAARYEIRTAQPAALKAALTPLSGVLLASRLDSAANGPLHGFAVLDPRARSEVARRLAEALDTPWLFVEFQATEEAGLLTGLHRRGLVLILHDPLAEKPTVRVTPGERQTHDELLFQALGCRPA
jgi:hypothetical protein